MNSHQRGVPSAASEFGVWGFERRSRIAVGADLGVGPGGSVAPVRSNSSRAGGGRAGGGYGGGGGGGPSRELPFIPQVCSVGAVPCLSLPVAGLGAGGDLVCRRRESSSTEIKNDARAPNVQYEAPLKERSGGRARGGGGLTVRIKITRAVHHLPWLTDVPVFFPFWDSPGFPLISPGFPLISHFPKGSVIDHQVQEVHDGRERGGFPVLWM